MTRDQIIAMAVDADIDPHDMCEDPVIAVNNLHRFAALVAAAMKERCAQICDAEASIEGIAQRCAAQIRALEEEA